MKPKKSQKLHNVGLGLLNKQKSECKAKLTFEQNNTLSPPKTEVKIAHQQSPLDSVKISQLGRTYDLPSIRKMQTSRNSKDTNLNEILAIERCKIVE